MSEGCSLYSTRKRELVRRYVPGSQTPGLLGSNMAQIWICADQAPTVERQNLTFEGLSEPLQLGLRERCCSLWKAALGVQRAAFRSWTALTPGILEEDLSTLFNELVALFNQLYEARL